jgi:hypothetical protein
MGLIPKPTLLASYIDDLRVMEAYSNQLMKEVDDNRNSLLREKLWSGGGYVAELVQTADFTKWFPLYSSSFKVRHNASLQCAFPQVGRMRFWL